jgi:hypothetical protein
MDFVAQNLRHQQCCSLPCQYDHCDDVQDQEEECLLKVQRGEPENNTSSALGNKIRKDGEYMPPAATITRNLPLVERQKTRSIAIMAYINSSFGTFHRFILCRGRHLRLDLALLLKCQSRRNKKTRICPAFCTSFPIISENDDSSNSGESLPEPISQREVGP